MSTLRCGVVMDGACLVWFGSFCVGVGLVLVRLCSFGRSVGRSVARSVARSVGRSVDSFVRWFIVRSDL